MPTVETLDSSQTPSQRGTPCHYMGRELGTLMILGELFSGFDILRMMFTAR